MISNSLIEKDRAHLLHPVVPLREHEARGVTVIDRAEGCFLTDMNGNTLLDAFAGLWCVNAGYGQETVVAAAADQMRRLPYATSYFHYGNEPAIELAAKLAELAPGDLSRVFFTLGGSDAVDTLVRIVRYYNNARGLPEKKQFISLLKGFHGSTSNGAGLTALPVFHEGFDVPMPWQHHIKAPYHFRDDPDGDTAIITKSVQALYSKVREIGADKIAAFICEPVQGSGGVLVYPKGYLTAMQSACRELGILFVTDEVITAFGRTGPMFACEHEGLCPDMMTIAKGLTSGYAPMGGVMFTDEIYDVIADAMADGVPFGHGFTYSGHPVSAAVGLEVLRLYTEGGLIANSKTVGPYFEMQLATLEDHSMVHSIRAQGLLAGIELHPEKIGDPKTISRRLADTGYSNKLIFRAFADGTIGLAPPICISKHEIDMVIGRLRKTLDDVHADCGAG